MNLAYDSERIKKLISSVQLSVALLKQLASLSLNDFLADPHIKSSAKYNFIAAIEAIIDLSNHLISRNKMRAAEDYADIFAVLAENKIIEETFAQELMKMARFRNRLVHLYWDIDDKELYGILISKLCDFENILKALGKHITL